MTRNATTRRSETDDGTADPETEGDTAAKSAEPSRGYRSTTETHDGLPADGSLRGSAPDERPRPAGQRTVDGVRMEQAAETDTTSGRRVLSAIVDHDPGVLTAVAGLFSRRMFNIESLTVGATADDDYARMTIVVDEPGAWVEQARKQLAGLTTVHIVRELDADAVERELALIKVDCDEPDDVKALAEMHGADVVDVCPSSTTVQVTGTEEEVDNAIEAFGRFSLREVSRTGTTALERASGTVYEDAHHGQRPPNFDPNMTDDHAESDDHAEADD
jgi:acetolactate synthase-1/3 small subunit